MRYTFACLFLVSVAGLAGAQTPKAAEVRSPLAGSDAGRTKIEAAVAPGNRLRSIEVNVGRFRNAGEVVKGLKLTAVGADGKPVETVAGPADGTWAKAVTVAEGTDLVGISGKHGQVLDSIRFHFSDGTSSPLFGGEGGEEEYRLVLRQRDGKYRGAVQGFYGNAGRGGLTGIGLVLVGRNGAAPELVGPDTVELTIRGEVDGKLAPVAGQLAALYYECYPALIKRFEDPDKPAGRHVTLVFKRNMRVPAYCSGSEVSVSIDWLTRHPDDVALLTHELTHAVQAYPVYEPSWMVEGIADYSRHLYGPKDQGGWKLPTRLTAKQSYKDSYRTTGAFLLWLDGKYPGVVDKLHRRLQHREFAVSDFKELTGKTVDALWDECVKESAEKKKEEPVTKDK